MLLPAGRILMSAQLLRVGKLGKQKTGASVSARSNLHAVRQGACSRYRMRPL